MGLPHRSILKSGFLMEIQAAGGGVKDSKFPLPEGFSQTQDMFSLDYGPPGVQTTMDPAYFDALGQKTGQVRNEGAFTVAGEKGRWKRDPDGSITIDYTTPSSDTIQKEHVALNDDFSFSITRTELLKDDSEHRSSKTESRYDQNGSLVQRNADYPMGWREEKFTNGRRTSIKFSEHSDQGSSTSHAKEEHTTVFDRSGKIIDEAGDIEYALEERNTYDTKTQHLTVDKDGIENRTTTHSIKGIDGYHANFTSEEITRETRDKGREIFFERTSDQSTFGDPDGKSLIKHSHAVRTKSFDKEGQLVRATVEEETDHVGEYSSRDFTSVERLNDGTFRRYVSSTGQGVPGSTFYIGTIEDTIISGDGKLISGSKDEVDGQGKRTRWEVQGGAFVKVSDGSDPPSPTSSTPSEPVASGSPSLLIGQPPPVNKLVVSVATQKETPQKMPTVSRMKFSV